MNVNIVVDWVWREHFEYDVTLDLPADWESMEGEAKFDWLEQFDCVKMDTYPIQFVEVIEVEEVY